MTGLGALAGAASVFEGFHKAISGAGERESAAFNLTAIAGGADNARNAFAKLEKISAETATDFPKLAAGVKPLMEAGLSADQAADDLEKLQKIALNSGASLEDLSDIWSRVITKQDVSSKDMVKLAMAGIPGMSELARHCNDIWHKGRCRNAFDRICWRCRNAFDRIWWRCRNLELGSRTSRSGS